MTPEEIDEMPCGTETDATIERLVFGYTVHRCIDGSYRSNSGLAGRKRNVPNYSTDIRDAWRLVEKFNIIVWPLGTGTYKALKGKAKGYAKSAPLAICRAALKVPA
jgi:hypothetical protein